MHRVLSSTGSGYLHGCFQVALRLPEHAARYSATRDSRTVETTGVAATSCVTRMRGTRNARVTRMNSCLKRWTSCSTGARRAPNRSAPTSSNQLQSSVLALAGNPERKKFFRTPSTDWKGVAKRTGKRSHLLPRGLPAADPATRR